MNKCIKLFGLFLVLAFFATACSDDDKEEEKNDDLIGKYEYKNFQFDFKYKGDTIKITIPGVELPAPSALPPLTSDYIKGLVNPLGKEAMADNFKNIEFKENNTFNLQFEAKKGEMEIGGTYKKENNTITLSLDNQKLQQLTQIPGLQIPDIKFNFTLNEDDLILVLDWNNLNTALQSFMSTAMFTELIKGLIASYNPELATDMVINILKTYLQTSILSNVEKLEGTFTLKEV